jgi:nicotinamidase-related amidase
MIYKNRCKGGFDMQDLMENWHDIIAPGAPELKPVTISSSHTALLILDLQKNNCNDERRPRCLNTVPGIRKLIEWARTNSLPVVYSLTTQADPADILEDVAPLPGDHIVKSSVDKFFGTDLGDHLKQADIDTVIIAGTAAEGAVLHTTAGAAMRGFNIVVPVDGLSSSTVYAEQYTVWHLANSPGTKKRTTLTRMKMISM